MIFQKKTSDDLGRVSPEKYSGNEKGDIYLLLDNVRSAHNVGSLFRIADCFGVKKIFLLGITPQPPHKDIFKTSLGATESVSWEHFEEGKQVTSDLKKHGISIVSVEQAFNSVFLQSFQHKNYTPICFVFGNEVFGVSKNLLKASDAVVEIPQFGSKHSFNVTISAGIVLWSWFDS